MYYLAVTGFKNFSGKHQIMFQPGVMRTDHTADNLLNSGSFKDKINRTETRIFAQYSGNYKNVNLAAYAMYLFNHDNVNGLSYDRNYPGAGMAMQWTPSPNHSLTVHLNAGATEIRSDWMNPTVIQRNEFLYSSGNPDLYYPKRFGASLSYSWSPNNNFSASLYTNASLHNKPVSFYYHPYLDGQAVIRDITNSGHYDFKNIAANVTWRLLNGNLRLSAFSRLEHNRITGVNAQSFSNFTYHLTASYFLERFYFDFYYYSKQRIYDALTNYRTTIADRMAVSAGWSNGDNVNVRLRLRNFNHPHDFVTNKGSMTSQYYSTTTRDMSYTGGLNIEFSIAYTISYGKKLRHDNSFDQEKTINSSTGGNY